MTYQVLVPTPCYVDAVVVAGVRIEVKVHVRKGERLVVHGSTPDPMDVVQVFGMFEAGWQQVKEGST